MSLPKVIFLDIDGPIINTPLYFIDPMCSMDRSVMNTQAIGYLVKLAKFAGAKIVCNSTHNTHDITESWDGKARTLRDDLIYWKVPAELFHEDWKTSYPYPPESKFSEASESRRLRAIDLWQKQNGEADWIAFDDENFGHERLMLVDFDRGIDYDLFRRAITFWGLDAKYGVVGDLIL